MDQRHNCTTSEAIERMTTLLQQLPKEEIFQQLKSIERIAKLHRRPKRQPTYPLALVANAEP